MKVKKSKVKSKTMLIRNFKKEDALAVIKLAKEMVDHHHEIDPYYKPWNKYKGLKKHIRGWVKERDTKVLVAEEDGGIVGYARLSVAKSPSYLAPEKIGIIYDLLISKPYRRRRMGELLFHSSMDWFMAKKIKNIELSVDARNISGVEFWKKFGFFGYKLRMRLDL